MGSLSFEEGVEVIFRLYMGEWRREVAHRYGLSKSALAQRAAGKTYALELEEARRRYIARFGTEPPVIYHRIPECIK